MFLEQVLRPLEARLGPDSLLVAMALHVLSVCARRAGVPTGAKGRFVRRLEIKEAILDPNDLDYRAVAMCGGVRAERRC